MARKVGGPLTESDYQKINQALMGLEGVHQEIQMALQAGMECSAEDQLCRDLMKRLQDIKAVYFPMHP